MLETLHSKKKQQQQQQTLSGVSENSFPNVQKKSCRMKLQVKFQAEDLHHTYVDIFKQICCCQFFLLILSIFDGNNIHETTTERPLHRSFLCNDHLPYLLNLHNLHLHNLHNFPSFSCLLLLKISCLFHFNRKMKQKRKIPWWSNIYFFAWAGQEKFGARSYRAPAVHQK